jgi:hypothetical protein
MPQWRKFHQSKLTATMTRCLSKNPGNRISIPPSPTFQTNNHFQAHTSIQTPAPTRSQRRTQLYHKTQPRLHPHPVLSPDSSRTVHFLHGTTVIPTANVPLAVRTAALEAIAWWKGGPRGNPKVTTRLAINRLGKPIQKTDGVGYSCDRCSRKHLVCV